MLIVNSTFTRCLVFVLGLLLLQSKAHTAGVGDSAPKKCSASDIEYEINNIVPSGSCGVITDTIKVDFDVNIWGNPQRYNLAVGYTNAGDSVLQDISCLQTGIDIDGVGCQDYNGSGTIASPHVAQSSFDVSCDLDGNLLVDPLLGVDFYVSFDANQGGTVAEITSPKCLLQAGNNFPLAPAKLQLTKNVTNDSGGTAVAQDFTLAATQTGGLNFLSETSGIVGELPAGDYSLTESGPGGYTLDSISCTGAPYDPATATITLSPSDSVQCVFNNNDDFITPVLTYLTLIKNVINDNGGTSLEDDFNLAINGSTVLSGTKTSVSPGVSMIISEADLANYTEGTWSCNDNNGVTTTLPNNGPAIGTKISLAAGSDVISQIENNDEPIIPATTALTLVKNVVNDSGGIAVADDNGSPVTSGATVSVTPDTDLLISEEALAAYKPGSWNCVDNNGLTTPLPASGTATGTTINLSPGSDVFCTIENDDRGVDISIAKSVSNNTPAVGEVITFTLQVN